MPFGHGKLRALAPAPKYQMNRPWTMAKVELYRTKFSGVHVCGEKMMTETTKAPIDQRSSMPLSVILPNFNHGAVIARALHALLSQMPRAKEIIVVDDGSTDNSVEVVETLQRQHPSIRLIRNDTNQGIIASVKTALDAASGEYLLLAASDDFVLPGLFSHALEGLTAYPDAAFFCAGVALLDSNNTLLGVRPVTVPRRGRGYLSPADVRRVIRKTDFWVLGTATVYRRRLLAEIGYFDAGLGSLGDVLANRLLAFRHGFYFDPEILAAYNKDPMSFSARNALSVKESRRFLDAASMWIAENLPEDVREEHGRLFDRRMRFGLARLWIIWQGKAQCERDVRHSQFRSIRPGCIRGNRTGAGVFECSRPWLDDAADAAI